MGFQTERTILRAYEPTDVHKLLDHWNSLEIQDLTSLDLAAPRTKQYIEKFAEKLQADDGLFIMIHDKATYNFIGQVSLTNPSRKNRVGEIGLSLVEEYRGKGYGKEILMWVIQHGFKNWGLHRIWLGTVDNNTAARALYESVGFVQEGVSREANWVGGKWHDLISYSILEQEWDIERGKRRQ